MEGTQQRALVRAGRHLLVVDRVADGLLGAGGLRAPALWGDAGARGAVLEDAGSERHLIREAVRLRHLRPARRRPLVNRIV
ncbi:MAG: hypothetical protein QOJ60_1860 [Actinomycetota bacterium]|nr:hypothetical protein [Actinomycetota bacterium]